MSNKELPTLKWQTQTGRCWGALGAREIHGIHNTLAFLLLCDRPPL